MQRICVADAAQWRTIARRLLAEAVPPDALQWDDASDAQAGLFEPAPTPSNPVASSFTVKKTFLQLAESVACHRAPERWGLLYAALWRQAHGEPHLLSITTDPLMQRLCTMEKQVRRDAHKTKAFVRFRRTEEDGVEHYIAWHRPDHRVLPLVASFFKRRFASMRWTILTSDQSVHWDGEQLTFAGGVPAGHAPQEDALEELWRGYYRATFNPARIKIAMMKREMPVRHWATLPETRIIADMLREAPARVQTMLAHQEGFAGSAADLLPAERSLPELRRAAGACEACPLYRDATQTVFGSGPPNAALMLVGEQPGDEEDLAGTPFIGPAGRLLRQLLAEAGIDPAQTYITNAVKHFKFTRQGSRRLHQTPGIREVNACKPWLLAEIEAVQPKAIVCLGVTAARALLGPGFTLKGNLGQWLTLDGRSLLASYHPAAILRSEGERQTGFQAQLQRDLHQAAALIDRTATKP